MPHYYRFEKPPFSASELAVFACLTDDDEGDGMTKGEILEWITRHFIYYRWLALQAYAEWQDIVVDISEPEHRCFERPAVVMDGFQHIFSDAEVPFVDQDHNETVNSANAHETRIVVPTIEGRLYLRRWLEPARKGTFPFLELPAEIRNVIYDMVFTFPEPGFGFGTPKQQIPFSFKLLAREHDLHPPPASWSTMAKRMRVWNNKIYDWSLPTSGPINKVLSLLTVSNQVHHEAVSCFYQINAFHFLDFGRSSTLLARMPMSRAKHLSRVSINLDLGTVFKRSGEGTMAFFVAGMTSLATAERLERLDVQAADYGWLNMNGKDLLLLGRRRDFKSIAKIPGFRELAVAASKTKELNISGDCPKIQAFLQAEVQALRTAVPNMKKRSRAAGKDIGKTEENIQGPMTRAKRQKMMQQ